jgi:hypothetical protein
MATSPASVSTPSLPIRTLAITESTSSCLSAIKLMGLSFRALSLLRVLAG